MPAAVLLAHFPDEALALLWLLLVSDLTLEEAAARLDLTPSEALTVWRRALASVRA